MLDESFLMDVNVNDEGSNDDKSFEILYTNVEAQSKLNNYEVNFVFHDEGYTLVNILKQYLFDMPEIQFVGRRKHNKLDKFINLRIKLNKVKVDRSGKPPEIFIKECLHVACRKALEDALQFRNSIPDVEKRSITFDNGSGSSSSSSSGDSGNISTEVRDVNLFETIFDGDDFKF